MDGELNRHPIQLKPDVKADFDRIHGELGRETQSETLRVLIDYYRANSAQIKV